MQLPKIGLLIVISVTPSAVTVPSEVPAILWISVLANLSVFVGKVQVPKGVSSSTPVTVSTELPVLVIVHLTVDSLHVLSTLPAVSVCRMDPPAGMLQSSVMPTGQSWPGGHGSAVVEQRTVAEALPAPAIAIRAVAAIAARPNIFRYLMTSSLPGARRTPDRVSDFRPNKPRGVQSRTAKYLTGAVCR